MARLVNESGVLGDAMDVTAESVKDIPFHTLVEAIHEVQTEMDVTGTTALEAEETVSGSFGTMIAAAQNLAAGLGDPMADVEVLFQVLGDTVVIFVDNIKRVLNTMWDNLPLTDFQKWVGVIAVAAGPLLVVLGGLLVGVGNVVTALSGATTVMAFITNLSAPLAAGIQGIGAVFTLLTGPIGIAIAAIAAVAAVLVYLYNTNEEFRAVIENIWLNIQLIFQEVTQIISDILMMVFETLSVWWQENQQGFMDIVMSVWTAISNFFIVIFTAIGDIINAIWQPISDWYQTNQEEIKATIEVVWNAISSVFMTVMAVIGTVIEAGFNFVSNIIETVMPYVETIIDNVMYAVMNVISLVMGIIRGDWSAVWEAIKNIARSVWNAIKAVVQGGIQLVLSLISNVMSTISNVWSAGWDGVLNILTSIWDTIRSYLSSLFDSIIQSVINWVGQFAPNIADGLQRAYDTVKGWASNFLNAGENIVKNIANGIKGGVSWVTDAIGNVTQKIRDFLPFSPPKDKSSPLAGIEKNGITEQIAKGIYSGEGEIKRAMNRTLDIGVANPQINGRVEHEMTNNMNTQPAYINLNIGGTSYRAFVENISNEQGRITDLELQF